MLKRIVIVTLITGTLDIVAACISAWLGSSTPPVSVLRFIASGVFGGAAFSGGAEMVLAGLLFHFSIVFVIITIFFLAYQRIPALQLSVMMNALLVAVAAWAIMTYVVVPLSKIKPSYPGALQAFIAIAILFVCIGLPAAFAAKSFGPTEQVDRF